VEKALARIEAGCIMPITWQRSQVRVRGAKG
jgi:hypothetical protein